MFSQKTVFIVGAGGSRELGLPMGDELKGKIGQAIAFTFPDGYNPSGGDSAVYWAAKNHASNVGQTDTNPWWHAGRAIKAAMPQAISIDNFLHTHSNDEQIALMGKLGIAVSILKAERQSSVYTDPHAESLNFGSIKESWHTTFIKMLTENFRTTNLDSLFENVSFITFNYDRCIEYYFAKALQSYLRIPPITAQKIVNKITIIHPYGQVGRLPWQPSGKVEFGKDPHHSELLEVALQIRTFTERVEDDDMMAQMHSLIAEAEQVIYLGFSYGAMNLELLSLTDSGARKNVLGTSLGISDPNREVIVDEIRSSMGPDASVVTRMELPAMTCNELLHAYWRRIAR
ncbi:MAG: hypothetical protein LCH86_06970 [Proteobacteria bacterium]|nr:hypothetical protein [Pseudomonadota bacterium]